MNQNLVITLVVIAAIALVIFLLTRSKKGTQGQVSKAPAPDDAEHGDVVSSAAAAIEDVAGPFIGIDIHHDMSGPPDDLTVIKGLGPKAAAQLKLLGFTHYAQLGALDTAQVAALDQQMGVFRGRIERDRWVEQARHLGRGDKAAFEQEFGKLG